MKAHSLTRVLTLTAICGFSLTACGAKENATQGTSGVQFFNLHRAENTLNRVAELRVESGKAGSGPSEIGTPTAYWRGTIDAGTEGFSAGEPCLLKMNPKYYSERLPSIQLYLGADRVERREGSNFYYNGFELEQSTVTLPSGMRGTENKGWNRTTGLFIPGSRNYYVSVIVENDTTAVQVHFGYPGQGKAGSCSLIAD